MQNPGGVIHGIFSFNDLINRSFNNGFSPEKAISGKNIPFEPASHSS
jgi:hypothetical protein